MHTMRILKIAADTRIEVAKVVVIGGAYLQESVPQSTLKKVCIEFPPYRWNTNGLRKVRLFLRDMTRTSCEFLD